MTEKIHLTGSVCSAVNNENDNLYDVNTAGAYSF